MNISKIGVIITAGGNSTRFGSNKLLEKVSKLSVIELTISKFIDIADFIVIPCQDDIKNHILNSKLYCNKIIFAPPGKTRQKSVYNAIQIIKEDCILLIHDGARPFVEKETIEDVIKYTKKYNACVAGIFAVDTVKKVEDSFIVDTIDRKKIFLAHTPQGFKFDLIKKIHDKYKNSSDFTDDSSMVESAGIKVYALLDKKNNIKITTKDDLY